MSLRVRAVLTLAATVGVLTVGGVVPSRAQTAPAPVSSPPTTRSALDEIVGSLFGPPKPAPAPAQPAVAPPPPARPPAVAPVAARAAAPPQPAPAAARVIPPEFSGIISSVRRTGPRNTLALLDALRSLEDVGLRPEEAALVGMGRFPVAGRANYTDDWLNPRFTPTFHLHQGTDIFATRGTPVRSPAEGVVRFADEATGGKSAYVTAPDGTYYYMTHLNGFNKALRSGARVKLGEVVGYVGNTGNAFDSSPHLHFEIHPRGGPAINPKPILDTWLAEAVAGVPALLAARNVNPPRPVADTAALRRIEEPLAFSPSGVAPLLWASSVSAGGTTLAMAQAHAARAASRINWQQRATQEQIRSDDLRLAVGTARSLLVPVTPGPLARLLVPGGVEGA